MSCEIFFEKERMISSNFDNCLTYIFVPEGDFFVLNASKTNHFPIMRVTFNKFYRTNIIVYKPEYIYPGKINRDIKLFAFYLPTI